MKLLKIYNMLQELRVLSPQLRTLESEAPLRDSDTIRVYHGFNDYQDAITAVKIGFSGKQKARRIYSYESNNNPYGLFITLDLDIAKKFCHPRGDRGIAVILELSVRVADLEAPVWPGGSYTVQGQMAQFWKDDKDRHTQGTLKARDAASRSEYPFVSGSDRPEVAMSLLSGERQALFMGDINPNMVKRVFFGESGRHGFNADRMERLTRKEFLNKFETHEPEKGYSSRTGKYDAITDKGYDYHKKKGRLFKPTDDFSMDILSQKLKKHGYGDGGEEEAMEFLKLSNRPDWFWPKQEEQIKTLLNKRSN